MLYPQPQIVCLSLNDAGFPVNLLHFDAHKLVRLGISLEEANAIVRLLLTKQTMLQYWRRLAKAGIPKDDARRIARAIAKYDVSYTQPDNQQQQLIRYYCPIVCRCGLWRSALLLGSRGGGE